MYRFTLFYIILFSSLLTRAEQPFCTSTVCVPLETPTDTVFQYINTIQNNSKNNAWVFFEKDTSMSNDKLIFFRLKHRPEGSMSMFEWIVDGNVNWGNVTYELWSTFIKIIPPNEKFTVVTLSGNTNYELLRALRVIPEEELIQIFSPLSVIKPTDIPLYQQDIIVVPDKVCKDIR